MCQPKRNDKRHRFIRVDGEYYDIGSLHHPGGDHIFDRLTDTDASWAIRVGHPKDPHVMRMLQRHYKLLPSHRNFKLAKTRIGENSAEVEALVSAYDAVPESHRVYSWDALFLQCFVIGGAFLLGLYQLGAMDNWWTGVWLCAIAQHWCFHYVLHNACHHAILSTGHKNRALARWSGFLIAGWCGRSMIANHTEHHVFTNVEHFDEGLDTGLVTWFVGQAKTSRHWLLKELHRVQHLLWWPQLGLAGIAAYLVTFSNWLSFLNGCYYDSSKRPQVSPTSKECFLFLLRNVGFCYYFGFSAFFASAYLGSVLATVVGSANHFMFDVIKPIDFYKHLPVIGHINSTTHDVHEAGSTISAGVLLFHWFFAWINFHLVHHLFPGVGLHHVQAYQIQAKKLVEEFGYKYNILSLTKTYEVMYQKMKKIAAMESTNDDDGRHGGGHGDKCIQQHTISTKMARESSKKDLFLDLTPQLVIPIASTTAGRQQKVARSA